MQGVIYQLIFPNDKSYVGQARDFAKRMRSHAKPKTKRNDGHLVQKAIRKHGWGNVQKIVLESGLSDEELDSREQHWISECRSLADENGYNLTKGGDDQPMDNTVVQAWHKKQMRAAMNRPEVRAKKSCGKTATIVQ